MPGTFPSGGSNPFAEDVNPYAAPREADNFEPPAVGTAPFAGLWRHGHLLVMHKAAPLPDICLKSNEPATRRLKRNLSWHHPALFLLVLLHIFIYAVVALIVRKTAKISIPLTEEWYRRRQRRMLIAWSILLLCGVLFGVSVAYMDQTEWAPFVMIVAILLFLGTAITGLISCRLVAPKKMTDTYVWLKGVHPGFLDRLEPWTWNL